jgi:hypothetical protein
VIILGGKAAKKYSLGAVCRREFIKAHWEALDGRGGRQGNFFRFPKQIVHGIINVLIMMVLHQGHIQDDFTTTSGSLLGCIHGFGRN